MKKTILFYSIIFLASIQLNAQCPPSTSTIDLDIANVRAQLHNGGDMWWDLIGNARYEVPKGSGKYSLFAGGIWIGGIDGEGNLRVAAQTYRQSGNDFWPGPIDTINATVSPAVCSQYDRFWKINKQDVLDFINSSAAPTADMSTWPGNGSAFNGQAHYLAPFEDVNNDGHYNVADGDYPKFDGINGAFTCHGSLHGDQSIWWVFNDVGNIHTETGSMFSIGLEIQCQAFAFNSSNQDIANATFYEYKIINRSSLTLNDSYFGCWTDVDLGNYLDDYVGCDVGRNMAYAYNGDNYDDGSYGYGNYPPAIGIDIFNGPFADAGDGIDNNRNGVIDEAGEQCLMSKFMYYENDFTNIGNPSLAQHYYDYMRGIWKDGRQLTYGGSGNNSIGTPCDFMFPDNSDPMHWGTAGLDPGYNWSEINSTPGQTNVAGDRRFLQSSGKFTMLPGAVNYVNVGAIWARDSAGGPFYSRNALRRADDLIQNLADNCYDLNLVGIQSVDFEKMLVFPNPAHSTISFELPYANGNKYSVKIYNSLGKLVKMLNESILRCFTIDISDLPAGIYVYNISSDKGNSSAGKFIKH